MGLTSDKKGEGVGDKFLHNMLESKPSIKSHHLQKKKSPTLSERSCHSFLICCADQFSDSILQD
jgi:hypothetical protein